MSSLISPLRSLQVEWKQTREFVRRRRRQKQRHEHFPREGNSCTGSKRHFARCWAQRTASREGGKTGLRSDNTWSEMLSDPKATGKWPFRSSCRLFWFLNKKPLSTRTSGRLMGSCLEVKWAATVPNLLRTHKASDRHTITASEPTTSRIMEPTQEFRN